MAVSGIDTTSAAALTQKTTNATSSVLDKDAFLQLLVKQMQYQDPLSPTDNTEYMSQLAQFSEMEAMNNLNTSYENSQALGLVGQYVLLNTKDASGNAKQVGGLVQYVTISNNQALLRVNDEYYTMDELDSVVDYDYIQYLNKKAQEAAGETTDDTDKKDETNTDTDNTTQEKE